MDLRIFENLEQARLLYESPAEGIFLRRAYLIGSTHWILTQKGIK